ncbi:MAG: hypothetical protein H8E42_05160 [Nitrospinae bacterium]|nr:hypothetical protein [Nitrospinota bacterium]
MMIIVLPAINLKQPMTRISTVIATLKPQPKSLQKNFGKFTLKVFASIEHMQQDIWHESTGMPNVRAAKSYCKEIGARPWKF